MYRGLLILLTLIIIGTPFSGIPGAAEDIVMQVAAGIVLALILILPRRMLLRGKGGVSVGEV